jgi:hypothetical protein
MPIPAHRTPIVERALLERRTTELLTAELDGHVDGVADNTVVSTYIRAAVRDLRGSICPDALPEMAARLVRYRLTQPPARR